MVQADNRSEPQQAVVAAQQVIEEGADVLFFTGEALTAAAAAPVAEENDAAQLHDRARTSPASGRRLPADSPSAPTRACSARQAPAPPSCTRRGSGTRSCSATPRSSTARLAARPSSRPGSTSAARSPARPISRTATSRSQARSPSCRSSDADAVFMCSYPPGGAAAIKQIRAAGIDVPISGRAGFDGTFWLKGIPDTEDIYVTSNGSAYDPPNEATAKLFESLKRAGVDTDISGDLLGDLRRRTADPRRDRGNRQRRRQRARRCARGKAPPDGYRQGHLHQGRPPPDSDLADLRVLRRQAETGDRVKPQFIPEYGG